MSHLVNTSRSTVIEHGLVIIVDISGFTKLVFDTELIAGRNIYLAMKLCDAPLKLGSTKNDSIHKIFEELEEIDCAVSYKDLQCAKFIIFPSKLDQAEMLAKYKYAVNVSLIQNILRALQRYNSNESTLDPVAYQNKKR